jgi:hypothetical protein
MTENENLVLEGTENVETPTEERVEQVETPKVYTEDEFNQKFNEAVGKKLARQEAKIRKEYDRKYGRLEKVLKAGTGKEDVDEMTDTFEKFYESKGITIPKEPTYSNEDIDTLAESDANKIIKLGFEEVKDEADRLNDLGFDNMSARDKALFVKLTDHIKNTETSRKLAQIGVTEDVYNSAEFKDFAKMFGSDTSIEKIYEIYNKTQPRKEIQTMGSMKNNKVDNGVKDYYTPEEIERMTEEDLDNPKVWEAVRRSMTGG